MICDVCNREIEEDEGCGFLECPQGPELDDYDYKELEFEDDYEREYNPDFFEEDV